MAVKVQKDQTVVDTGPYRYVRHPSYTGLLIIFVGLGLALQSWGAVLVLALIFAVVWGYRIHVEERALISQLGEAYLRIRAGQKGSFPTCSDVLWISGNVIDQ
ncbi:MAG: isoprenylcysteine carboxylmethyltransferase family protein [Halobacteriota archaeon]